MLRAFADFMYYIDRIFPRVKVGGRESDRAYSMWEYSIGKELLETYSEQLGDMRGKAVLDIGCGLGGKTVAYDEAGASVIGVDISKDNIAQSVEFAGSMGSSACFVTADVEDLPFEAEAFDLVVANDSMEHFPSPARALAEMARVVRIGGSIALFFTPWGSPLGSHLYDYLYTPWCHRIYSEKLIQAMLETVLRKRSSHDPRGEAAKLMENYRTELNRITVARYRSIVDSIPSLEPVFEKLRPPKFSIFRPLTRIPCLGEFFTGTVIAILRKRN